MRALHVIELGNSAAERGTGVTRWALYVTMMLAAAAAPVRAETIAIVGGTVYVRADRKLENATVIVRDGKIAEVGAGVAVPAGATRIEAAGKVVTAGLIEAATQLGLIEVDLEASGNDGRFGNAEVHAAFRTADAYDGRSVAIPVARTGGVTSAITGPSGGLVAGQSAWVSLADGAAVPAPIRAIAAMNGELGRGAIPSGSRGRAVERMRELFDDVDLYRRNRASFDRNQSRRLAAGRLDLEALVPVLEGRVPFVIAANAEVDIRAALAVAAERRLAIAIVGGGEAWRLAKELAAAKVPVIVDPTDNIPRDLGALDVRDDNAALLAKAGVPVAISTIGRPSDVRTLRQMAGIAVANGLPWEKGLAAITSAPAQIFGAVGQRGTLDRGAAGDVVVWSGDPLELTTRAEVVIIGGAVQSLDTHQTRLRERYRNLPK
ncbi:MAG: amidohydrolase family protein [Deltaproteobacteria bacterium]|nr:amidohydrolase family protein [Deltaproteobacteria bacterium]